jgi:hypothetical protein
VKSRCWRNTLAGALQTELPRRPPNGSSIAGAALAPGLLGGQADRDHSVDWLAAA